MLKPQAKSATTAPEMLKSGKCPHNSQKRREAQRNPRRFVIAREPLPHRETACRPRTADLPAQPARPTDLASQPIIAAIVVAAGKRRAGERRRRPDPKAIPDAGGQAGPDPLHRGMLSADDDRLRPAGHPRRPWRSLRRAWPQRSPPAAAGDTAARRASNRCWRGSRRLRQVRAGPRADPRCRAAAGRSRRSIGGVIAALDDARRRRCPASR